MFKLYEITDQYKAVIDSMLDDSDEDKLTLDQIKENFETKVINCVKYLKNLEAEQNAIQQEIANMSIRYKKIVKNIDALNDYIASNIQETGLLDPIKCPEFTVKLQNNPPSVDIYDDNVIPEAYKVIETTVRFNKDLMKKDLKEEFEIPGARLVTKKRLVIK